MVYRPSEFVRVRRVTCVSTDFASTVAPGIGAPAVFVMTPVRMSVVEPT